MNETHTQTVSGGEIVAVSAAGGTCETPNPDDDISMFVRGGQSNAYEFTVVANVRVDDASHGLESVTLTEPEWGEYTLELATAIDEEKPATPCDAHVPVEVILRIPSELDEYTVTVRENGDMAGVWRSE